MAEVFGTKFIIVNDVRQFLPPNIFGGGPWLHRATVVRGLKEYCCFEHSPSGKIYIEEADPSSPVLFKRIEDQNEWEELYQFLLNAGILYFGKDKEFHVAN